MENKLKVEYVDIDTIKPYKNNAKYFVYIHILISFRRIKK